MTLSCRLLSCLLFLGVVTLQAQDIQKVLPQTLPANPPVQAPTPPEIPQGPGGQDQIIAKVRGLVFVSGSDQLKKEGLPLFDGVRVASLPYLDQPDFQTKAKAFLGQPLTADTLNAITRLVVAQYVANDHPVVDATIPEQNISNGIVQVVVVEGHVHEVKTVGNQWFNGAVLAGEVGLQPGDTISQHELVQNLNTMNQNPFRDVSAEFARGSDEGTTDVLLKTEDRFPVRFYTGYDNTGNLTTGQDRWNAGFNYGNLFGLDQQFNYQFTMSSDLDRFKAHAASYIVPLPWHHSLTFFGGFINTVGHPQGTNLEGYSWQASARYNIPLPTIGQYTQTLSAGYDFKESNNDLEFGGQQVFNTTTQVSQFVTAYNSSLTDNWGTTTLGLNCYLSPGDMTSGNTTQDFAGARKGAHSDYVYGQATLNRVTRLPGDFSWVFKGAYQDASTNLLGSEQFGLGGADTVRGYQEREANGDEGWLVSNEIRTPAYSISSWFAPKFGTNIAHDQLQFLGFVDYGWTRDINLLPGEDPNIYLLGVGPGLRYTIDRYVSVKFDYGFQLTDTGLGDPFGSRGSLAVTISY